MGIPVVVTPSGGLPVKLVDADAPVLTVSANGLGLPVTFSDRGMPFVVEGGSNWFDDPQYDAMQAVVLGDGRAARWNGEPQVDGRWPKTAAEPNEVLSIIAPAGRGYLPTPTGHYQFDTPANAFRFDTYRGRPQLVVEPLPRFNRIFPSTAPAAVLNLPMIAYPYIVGMRGSGSLRFDGAAVGPTGTFTLQGEDADTWVWGIMPHTALENVTITPTGQVLDAVADTHGVTGLDPDYPTLPIYTTTTRVDQAAEVVQVVNPPEVQGTFVIQGQFYAVPRAGERRTVIGWDYSGHLSIDAAGNVLCSANGGNLSTPLGQGDGGDPFRVVVSFREWSNGVSGMTRIAGNGGAAVQYEAPYGAGLGEHINMFIARTQSNTGEFGGGAFDMIGWTPDLLSNAEVSALSEYPNFVAGHSPTQK